MREGSLQAPTRNPIPWQQADYYDEEILDAEMRRIFGVCHGCRRCVSLCDSFPRLFDMIDETASGELPEVTSDKFESVVEACTLCHMCYITQCPYVPPHIFNVDFPHLMLRYRAVQHKSGKTARSRALLSDTDRIASMAGPVAALANWATDTRNDLTRPLLEKGAGVHREAVLPRFHGKTLVHRARKERVFIDATAPAYGRKSVLYATCFVNHNDPPVGEAARRVLAANGVETEVIYPGCCSMPHLEHGDLARVSDAAGRVARALEPWIDLGYAVLALTPGCALMLKDQWPLIVPDQAEYRAAVTKLAAATHDLSEYIVDIARTEGLASGLRPVPGGVTLHIACHARAQNMGQKAAELLRLIPGQDVTVIERCSGHGGSWGVREDCFDMGLKVGEPLARQALSAETVYVVSECPRAGPHIVQGMQRLDARKAQTVTVRHPVQILAAAYGLA